MAKMHEGRGTPGLCAGVGGQPWGPEAPASRALPPPEGYYLHMDSNNFHQGGVARLRSPDIWEQGPFCVRFAYHMFGLSWGSWLRLLLSMGKQNNRPKLLWKHTNTQSPSWIPTSVTVPAGLNLPSWVRLREDPRAICGG